MLDAALPVPSFPLTGRMYPMAFIKKPLKQLGNEPQGSEALKPSSKSRCCISYSTYSHE